MKLVSGSDLHPICGEEMQVSQEGWDGVEEGRVQVMHLRGQDLGTERPHHLKAMQT